MWLWGLANPIWTGQGCRMEIPARADATVLSLKVV